MWLEKWIKQWELEEKRTKNHVLSMDNGILFNNNRILLKNFKFPSKWLLNAKKWNNDCYKIVTTLKNIYFDLKSEKDIFWLFNNNKIRFRF